MDVAGLKLWIEDLSAKNKLQEKEIETLKNGLTNSLVESEHLEQEKIQVKQENLDLKQQMIEMKQEHNDLVRFSTEENIQLKLENDQLKIEICELTKGPEIIDVASDSEDENNVQGNPENRPGVASSEIPHPLEKLLRTEQYVSLLMKFVNPRDLGACRLVCKMWSTDATEQMKMRSTFHLNFGYPEKVKRFLEIARTTFSGFRRLNLDIKTANLPNENVSKLLMDHGKYLHRVSVEFGNIGNRSCYGMAQFFDLFLASLQQIKHLKLQGLRIAFLQEHGIFNHGCQLLPCLTIIDIALKANERNDYEDTQVLATLLRISPNLKSLHWEKKQNERGGEHNGTKIMIRSLMRINPPKLEYLSLYGQVDPIIATLLTTSKLKLKELYFSELNGFKVRLVDPCTGWKTELTPFRRDNSQIPGHELKQRLENELAKFKKASCIELLKKFLNTHWQGRS